MTCQCKKNVIETHEHTIRPEEYCPICADKHFATAMQLAFEIGYEAVNRNCIVGELELARKHLAKETQLAEQIRHIRHLVQYRQEKEIGDKWNHICHAINLLIEIELKKNQNQKQGKIYIFAPVTYGKDAKIQTAKEDLLVFIGYNEIANQYHGSKICYHASSDDPPMPGCFNRYTAGPKKNLNPPDFSETIQKAFKRELTLTDIVLQHIARIAQNREIILVNFAENLDEIHHASYTYMSLPETLP